VIRIVQNVTKSKNIITEYSCPHCCKPIQWNAPIQMSPFNCFGCMERLMDISQIISSIAWRTKYHLNGEEAVKCGSSSVL
jgi:hypothetical protein